MNSTIIILVHLCLSLVSSRLSNGRRSRPQTPSYITTLRIKSETGEEVSVYWCIQLNSCNSNSYNSKTNIIRTDSLVPSEFTLKTLQENSYYSNPCNSKNYVNRTYISVPWRNFKHVIRIFELFEFLKLANSIFRQTNVFNRPFFDVRVIVWQSNVFFFAFGALVHWFCLPSLINTSKLFF